MRITSIAALAVIAAFTQACTTPPLVLEGFQPPATPVITIVDARAEAAKKSEVMSSWATSCDYGIYRVGDDKIVPGRLALLSKDLEAAMGTQLSNSTLTVSRYDIFQNSGAVMRETLSVGILPAMLSQIGNHCSKAETTGGWFARDEAPSGSTPFVIEMEAMLDGKLYAVRNVYAGTLATPLQNHVFEAMSQANAALIAQVKGVPPGAPPALMAASTGPVESYAQWSGKTAGAAPAAQPASNAPVAAATNAGTATRYSDWAKSTAAP